MTRAKAAVGLLIVVSLLSITAALIPVFEGGRISVTFLATGVVFFGVAMALAKKARTANNKVPPPA